MASPVLNPTMYARVTGLALAAVALLGIVMNLLNSPTLLADFLAFDWAHNIVHVVLAGVALFVGFTNGGAYARNYARIFGIVYTGLAVFGFIPGTSLGFMGIGLELGENLVHLVIGLWGLAAGFLGSTTTSGSSTTTTRGN
jgi:hypothetical protein